MNYTKITKTPTNLQKKDKKYSFYFGYSKSGKTRGGINCDDAPIYDCKENIDYVHENTPAPLRADGFVKNCALCMFESPAEIIEAGHVKPNMEIDIEKLCSETKVADMWRFKIEDGVTNYCLVSKSDHDNITSDPYDTRNTCRPGEEYWYCYAQSPYNGIQDSNGNITKSNEGKCCKKVNVKNRLLHSGGDDEVWRWVPSSREDCLKEYHEKRRETVWEDYGNETCDSLLYD